MFGRVNACGPRGMRPNVPFIPSRPVYPAGMRIEPPPSPPVASVSRPPDDRSGGAARRATDGAAVPPRVVRDAVELRDADVEPAELAGGGRARRARHRRRRRAARRGATCAAPRGRWNTSDASVHGQPATGSSSLIPVGTPPNGFDTSALRRGLTGAVGVDERDAVQVGRLDRRERRIELLDGRALARSGTRRRAEQQSPVQGASLTFGTVRAFLPPCPIPARASGRSRSASRRCRPARRSGRSGPRAPT